MPTTVFTNPLGIDFAAGSNNSLRQFVPVTGGSLGQVAVTFLSGTSGVGVVWACDHCSIAILGSATAPNVQSTPTELLFGGNHGFSLSTQNTPITSDWTTFSFASTDLVCVIMDFSITGAGNCQWSGPTGPDLWFVTSGASYNQASVVGFTDNPNHVFGVTLIQTQAPAAVSAPIGGRVL